MMSVQTTLFGYKNVLHVYLPMSSSPGTTISYFCHDAKRRGEGVASFPGPVGPRANTKYGAHNIDYWRGVWGTPPENFELLRALKCVLGASEAPFLCKHTVYTYLQVVFVQLQIKKYDVRGLS